MFCVYCGNSIPDFSTTKLMRKLVLIIVALPFLISVAYGQQDPQFTMYMFNRAVVNPAYVGSMEATNLTLLGRAQWVGIPGGPKTTTASLNGFVRNWNSGLGANIVVEELGPLQTMGLNVAYSYHISLSSDERMKLNIGVNGGLFQKGLYVPEDGWLYNTDNGVDPLVFDGDATAFVPDVGSGVYFHVKMPNKTSTAYPLDRFYIGAHVSHILEPSIEGILPTQGQGIGIDSKLHRGISATAGYTVDFGPNVFLQPSALFMTDLASSQLSLTANLYISPMVFGINYRGGMGLLANTDSFDGIVGFNANTNLFIGYAYDYTLSELNQFTSGSHELIVSYTFPTVTRPDIPILDPGRNSGHGRL